LPERRLRHLTAYQKKGSKGGDPHGFGLRHTNAQTKELVRLHRDNARLQKRVTPGGDDYFRPLLGIELDEPESDGKS
jgi:hypothetical protein